MAFFKNFIEILSALTLVDFIFFSSMLLLIILVVSLIYFIKINREEMPEEINVNILKEEEQQPIELQQLNVYDDENDAIIDLESISKALEERQISPIEMTDYELEQEERAIISYDELVERSKNLSLNYEIEEEPNPEINIKKVDLENLVSKVEDSKPSLEIRVISYQKEEAFLEALKNLKEQINWHSNKFINVDTIK